MVFSTLPGSWGISSIDYCFYKAFKRANPIQQAFTHSHSHDVLVCLINEHAENKA